MASTSNWIVLKFGGTSVATPERWQVIIDEVKRARDAGERPCVVVSALSQVTNRLNKSIEEALRGTTTTEENSSYQWIKSAHLKLADLLGLKPKEKSMIPVMELLEELQRLLEGIVLTQEASPKLCARICAFGELMSSQLGVYAIQAAGQPCVRLDARTLIKSLETSTQQEADRYLNANVNPVIDLKSVEEQLKLQKGADDCAVITQGFIGSTPKGHDCLLGRGGSDTSGALFAALLAARRLEIWTDVHGLFTSDPRHVNNTRLIQTTNYRVAQELASMGAKVLHPRCLVPAQWANIPVEVHNTQDPKGPCTRIESRASTNGDVDSTKATRKYLAVTQRSGQVLINITNLSMWGEAGFLSRVFLPFGELDVSVDLVATSQYAVSLTLDHIPGGVGGDVYTRLLERLNSLGTVSTKTECAVVSVVGENLRYALTELGKALSDSLADMEECNVHLMTQSSEDLNLSWVVDESHARELVQGLHNRLFPHTEAVGQTWEELRPPASGELKKSFSGISLDDGPSRRDSKLDFSPTAREKGKQASNASTGS